MNYACSEPPDNRARAVIVGRLASQRCIDCQAYASHVIIVNMNDNNVEETYDQLLDKVTHPKQRAFLENYPKFGEITSCAKAIGSERTTVWNWQQGEKGKAFHNAFNAVKKEYEAHLLLEHERNIDNIAFDKDAPAQSRVLASIFITKALAPDKYREKPPVVPFSGNIRVELSVPRPGALPLAEPKQLKGGKGATE